MTLDKVIVKSVGTTETDVDLHGMQFLIANNSANTVYFKEKAVDNAKCTASNGFSLAAGTQTVYPMRGKKLSLIASAASSDVRIITLRET